MAKARSFSDSRRVIKYGGKIIYEYFAPAVFISVSCPLTVPCVNVSLHIWDVYILYYLFILHYYHPEI